MTPAGSAAEALAAIRHAAGHGGAAGGEPVDVLVSDVGMPDEDGYAFVRRLRRWEAEASGSRPRP